MSWALLERRVDAHVDEIRPAAGQPSPDGRADFGRLLHALAGDSERAGQAHVVDERLVEIHADVEIVLGRESLQRERAMLDDAVGGVDYDDVAYRLRVGYWSMTGMATGS